MANEWSATSSCPITCTKSSDIKECWSQKFLHQKLDYIHNNPISGKWSLVDDPAKYAYWSAGFYMLGAEPIVPLLHMRELV